MSIHWIGEHGPEPVSITLPENLVIEKHSSFMQVSDEMMYPQFSDYKAPLPLRTRIQWWLYCKFSRFRIRLAEWIAGQRFEE